MLTGDQIVAALRQSGVTHVTWIPDSELGTWEAALAAANDLQLIRVAREGEAVGVAVGLWLGGKRPVVIMQITGFFEAGDAIRNAVHDLHAPLVFIVGLRGYFARQRGVSMDTCPLFAERILNAWQLPFQFLTDPRPSDLTDALSATASDGQARVLLLAE